MASFLFWLSLLLFVLTAFAALDLILGNRTLRRLEAVPAKLPSIELPKVSIIIPARNEARHIREALTSVLGLAYPGYEILVVNDRSEDETGQILADMREDYPQLRVVSVEILPTQWLGKNHALFLGAQQASGEMLLFTDADIVMEPQALRRAVTALLQQNLDHLTVIPELTAKGLWLNVFLCSFSIFFAHYSRPWKARDPKSPYHIGVGAFNLIRKSVYDAIGTHEAIALRPDDDMKLGKLVKKHGYRQDVLLGMGVVEVEWYHSMGELIEGLMKNAFAGLDYNLPLTILSVVMQFLIYVFPLLAVFFTTGPTQLLYSLCVLVLLMELWANSRTYQISPGYSLGYPFAAVCMMYIISRCTYLNLRDQGIYWRGTFYPLKALKANKV